MSKRILAIISLVCVACSFAFALPAFAGTGSTATLTFAASDLEDAVVTYQIGTDPAVEVDAALAEDGVVVIQDIPEGAAVTVRATAKEGAELAPREVGVHESAFDGMTAFGEPSNVDGGRAYTFTVRDSIAAYFVEIQFRQATDQPGPGEGDEQRGEGAGIDPSLLTQDVTVHFLTLDGDDQVVPMTERMGVGRMIINGKEMVFDGPNESYNPFTVTLERCGYESGAEPAQQNRLMFTDEFGGRSTQSAWLADEEGNKIAGSDFESLGNGDWAVTVDPAQSYRVVRVLGVQHFTVIWTTNSDTAEHWNCLKDDNGNCVEHGRFNTEMFVEHGQVQVLSLTRDGVTYSGEGLLELDGINFTEDFGHVLVNEGDDLTLKLIPDYGYQIGSIGGQDDLVLQAVSGSDNTSTFTIEDINSNIHFSSVFVPADNSVSGDTKARFEVSGQPVDSGTLDLSVESQGDNKYEINLQNVFFNGSQQVEDWSVPVTDLGESEAMVTLDLGKLNATSDYKVIREHEGEEPQELEATVKGSEITFATNKFSTYTIVEIPANTITAANKTVKAATVAKTYKLGAKALGGAKLTYASNNSKVKVDANGYITVARNYAGKATITITAAQTATYKKTVKKITVTVSKITNPLVAKVSKTKLRYSKLSDQKVAIKVSGAKGTVRYTTNSKKVTVKNGVVRIAKGFKGTAKIKVTASGAGIYAAGSKTLKIVVQ